MLQASINLRMGERRQRVEPGSGWAAQGEHRPARSAVFARHIFASWQSPVRPIAFAPDQPHQNRLGPRKGLFGHRYRPTTDVFKRHQIGQPQRRQPAFGPMPARRESPRSLVLKRTAQTRSAGVMPQSLGQVALSSPWFRERRHAWQFSPLAPRGSRLRFHVIMLCVSRPAGCGAGCPPKGGSNGCVTRSPTAAQQTHRFLSMPQRYSL